MSTRDVAINIINMMDDEQINSFVKLFNPVISDVPNEETIKAIEEAEELLKSPNAKKYNSVEELFEDLMA